MTPKRGGRRRDHRPVLNGIVFRTRAGIPWRDLPERYGPWETVDKRFARWQTDGTWARIEATLGTQADGLGSWTGTPRLTPASSAPTSTPPAPVKGAPADPGKPPAGAGTVTGGLTPSSIPSATAGPQPGHPPHSGPGRRHPAVDRVGGSGAGGAAWWSWRPRKRREHLTGDKAHSSRANRQALRARRIPHPIPERDDQQANRARRGARGGRPPAFDRSATASATRSSG